MTTTLRLNDELKHACDAILDDIGISFSAAVFFRAKAEAEAKGTRFRWTFVQFNEKYAKHNVKT